MVSFLTTSQPGFALVLAEFGTGKTYLMHELARRLVEAEPNTVPLLINLRSLSKATDLNQVRAQYIGSHPELSGLTLSSRLMLGWRATERSTTLPASARTCGCCRSLPT